jgi:aspartyl-tRNA(Asn)/glutamyl-tRNA(Gln) amidotransferase subunit A
MAHDDLCRLSATEAARLIATRQLSPVELTDAVLDRADRLDPVLNLFALRLDDEARRDARAAEQAVMAGDMLGALHGVSITIKDNVAIAGKPMRNGSMMTEGVIPKADTAVVTRIKAAGAIVIGKTTLPEFAHKVLTDSPLHGVTRNPWNLNHTPGGSSGGASAAVASGVAPLAVGTDGGGSIRFPASCAGIVGLKATLGRIPNETMPDGFANYAFVGPMARTAADTALLFSVMAGPHAHDPYSLATGSLRAEPTTINGLRIGWIEHFGPYRTTPEVASLTASTVARLADQGAIVQTLRTSCFDDVFETYVVIATTAHAARLGPLAERQGAAITDSLKVSIARGAGYSAVAWQRAHDQRTILFRAVQDLFNQYDVIATPTVTVPPPLLDAGGSVETQPYAAWAATLYPFNLTGHPAISVPAGLTTDGLPVGLQLVAPWFAEQRLLDLAGCLEATSSLPWPNI